ncbi:hypothetical protein H7R52_14145 [Weissella confusa]|uniref:Uncharacterized protein n=1 Tax=Weissella confusa TaxID=1583 RepID=A0A923NJI5_WEICO|nr:hypothetical protein [Weissella confusa]
MAIEALQYAITNAKNQGSGEHPTDNTPGETEPGTTLPDSVTTVPAPGQTPELVDVMPSVSDSDASTTKLQQAFDAANAARNTANDAGKRAITDANVSAVATDPAVVSAMRHLQDVMNNAANDNPEALTADPDIESATKAVQDAMNAAKSDRDAATTDANNLIGKVAPISNEPGVAEALQNLQDALNGTTTGSDIRDQVATKGLQDALQAEGQKRTTANNAAETAIDQAKQSKVAGDSAVQDALNHLQDVMNNAANNDPDALTPDDLKNAITAANTSRQTAVDAAETLLQQTAPLSNESAVSQSADKLNDLLDALKDDVVSNDPTTAELLITATATAKSLRDDANDTAETTIDGVQNDDVANEPSVQAAIDRLRDVMNEAAANNENNLTVDIQRAAIDALNAANDTAKVNQATAREAADSAISQTAPVSNESAVKDAQDKLQSLINDPTSTAKNIEGATKTPLQEALAADNEKRDSATTTGNQLIETTNAGATSNEPLVQKALADLQNVVNEAAMDTPNALTKDIQASAQKALEDAISGADAKQQEARDAAQDLIGKTAPVSNEVATAQARNALESVLANTLATANDIEEATQ